MTYPENPLTFPGKMKSWVLQLKVNPISWFH